MLEIEQPGVASTYPFINNMLRDVVYTGAGDAQRRLFDQWALDVLEAAKDSAAVLVYRAQAAGMSKAAFHYSIVARQASLHLSALSEVIVHFEHALAIDVERDKLG